MKKPTYKRILSAVLAVILFLSCVPGSIFANETPKFRVLAADGNTDLISLPRNCRTQLTAADAPEGAKLQWQIAMPDNQGWVDISGQEEETLSVSIALFASVMDEEDSASIRCAATLGGAEYFTDPIWVQSTAPVMAEPPEETYPQVYEEPVWEVFSESAEGSVPETTVPETTVPETTVPETTVPETTVPETTVPETTVPETTIPETTTSEEDAVFEIVTEEEFSLVSGAPRIADNGGQRSSASAPTTKIHTVTIDYYFKEVGSTSETLTPVWESFTATIAEGKELKVNVPNKTLPGYGTWVESKEGFTLVQDGTGSYIQVDIASVNEDISFDVYYKKVPVSYYVRYFLQNIVNDLYTEDPNLYDTTGTGLAGTVPTNIKKEITGFTALFHEPDFIAADGSTVFECYYDRNYYLINFELDGGYGVEPVYARYQYPLNVGTPTKPGYTFGGWDLVKVDGNAVTDGIGTADPLPDTIPHENRTYRAIWKTVETTYTVVYWKADLDDGKEETPVTYSYWGQKTVGAYSAMDLNPIDVGNLYPAKDEGLAEADYFTYDSDATAKKNPAKVTVEGNGSSVVNVYYSRRVYTIRFVYARRVSWDSTNHFQLADSTGCGAYNGTHDTASHTWYSVSWNYWVNENESPVVSDAYAANADEFTEISGENTVTYYYIGLTAEYGADIKEQWPANPIKPESASGHYSFGSWGAQCGSPYRKKDAEHANIVGPYPTMSADMIIDPENPIAQTMVAWWGCDGSWGNRNDYVGLHTYHIYIEALEGEEGTDDSLKTYQGNQYKLENSYEFNVAHNGTTRVDPFVYEGLTCVNDTNGKNPDSQANSKNYYYNSDCPNAKKADACEYCNCFYYDRQEYTLSFFNYNNASTKPDSETLKFGESLSRCKPGEDPEYPDGLEPDAYEFKGWYTTPDFYAGTEVDWSVPMPAGDLTLYAKWEPISHTVRFYDTYDHMMELDGAPIKEASVKHGSTMLTSDIPEAVHPDNTDKNYTFVGWFYMDENGQKVAFDPTEMEVRQPMKLYAEWKSPITTQYTISYMAEIDGKMVKIADDMTGYTFVATTKSFTAKAVPDLNLLPENEKKQLWLPETSSHSILMKETPGENVYTFYYVKMNEAPYWVHYLEAGTNRVLHKEKYDGENKKAIVTEPFIVITEEDANGKDIYYTPDAFHKQLTLSATESENVITFYYTRVKEDEEQQAPYQVTHYIQNEDGISYSIYTEEAPKFADVGTEISAPSISISGYKYMETKVFGADGKEVSSYKLPPTGLQVNLYYDRLDYKYTVKYVDDTTGNPIPLAENPVDRDPKPYNTTVTENAIAIPGYSLIGSQTQTLRIGFDVNHNVITFRYEPKNVTITYVPVCTIPYLTNFGNIMPVNQENLKANGLSNIRGATPLAASGFKFVGWYKEWDGVTGEVTGEIETDATNHMKPVITDSDLAAMDAENKPYEFTYYALFEPVKQSLTIKKEGANEGDTSLFSVNSMGKGLASANVIVSIQGSGSVTIDDLYCGEYSVQELTGWSWTYTTGTSQQTVVLTGDGATVTFTNTYQRPDWLHGENHEENQFDNIN